MIHEAGKTAKQSGSIHFVVEKETCRKAKKKIKESQSNPDGTM